MKPIKAWAVVETKTGKIVFVHVGIKGYFGPQAYEYIPVLITPITKKKCKK